MIRRNQQALNLANIATDFAANFFAIYLAYLLRFEVFQDGSLFQPFSHYRNIGILGAVLSVLVYAVSGLYEPKRRRMMEKDILIILRGNVINIAILSGLLYVQRWTEFSRVLLFFYFLCSCALVLAKHMTVRAVLQRYRSFGRNIKHVLVVGGGQLAQNYAYEIHQNPQLGYQISGYVSCGSSAPSSAEVGMERLGTIEDLDEILGKRQFDETVISLDESESEHLRDAISCCNLHGVRFSIIPSFTQYIFSATAPEVQTIGSAQVFDVCASPLDSAWNRFAKRAVDICASALLLILTSPVMLITAFGVKLTSPGPVLFRQERVGLKTNAFYMYKFRSMWVNAEQDTAWSQKGDSRVTKFGTFIRKTSIDELPQLFNILKGDMSLVGPRPEIPFHVNRLKTEVSHYMARHQIRPGLTGWAQVNGFRGDTSIDDRVKYDLYYIYNWSLLLDIRIILRTAFGGMLNK